MAGAPIYTSQQPAVEPQRVGTRAIDIPQLPNEVGSAVAELGKAGVDFAVKLQHAQEQSRELGARAEYLTELDKLQTKYTTNPEFSRDFQNAPKNFAEERTKLEGDILAREGLDRHSQDRLRLYMTSHGISTSAHVSRAAQVREAQHNIAVNDLEAEGALRTAATAGSGVERQAAIDGYINSTARMAAAGWISEPEAVNRNKRFRQSIDNADAMAEIRRDPDTAQKLLADPNNFKSLDPVTRQAHINQAQSASERLSLLEAQNLAKRDPLRALLTVGRTAGRDDAAVVFDRGILPIENATGDNTLISEKGAVGKSQILPATAKEVAQRLGLKVFEGLDEKAITKKLTEDPDLNLTLGREYWNQMAARYEGRIAVAAAAYNAGPGRADKWLAATFQKYGPHFTPAQFLESVDINETRDYIGKLYKGGGASLEAGAGLSPAGQLHAAATVHATLAQEERQDAASIKAIAKIYRDTDDPATIFKNGFEIDPPRFEAWRQQQMRAAQLGDGAAATALREADFQYKMLPYRQAALRTAPADQEAFLADAEAKLRGGKDVRPEDLKGLEVIRDTFKAVKQARDDNIIGLAEQALFVPADKRVAVDPRADPTDQNFRRALSIRGAQAEGAANFYLGKAIALKPEELGALKDRYAAAAPAEQYRIIEALGVSLTGRAYTDTLTALVGDSAIAQMAGQVARDRPELAQSILRGKALMDTKEVGDKAALVRPAFEGKLGGLMYVSPAMQNQVVEAALARYTDLRAKTGELYSGTDTSGIEKALEEVTGPIVKINGMRTPVTPSLNKAAFLNAFEKLEQADVDMMGRARDRAGRVVSAADISRYGVLKPHAPGSEFYFVGMRDPKASDGFLPLLDESGSPLVFNMRRLTEQRAAAPQPGREGTRSFRRQLYEGTRAIERDVEGGP